MKSLFSFILTIFVPLLTAIAQTVPGAMTYQGRLTNASGAPVPDGNGYEIEVRLWDAPTGGTLLWGTSYTGVPLRGGAFNLILGPGGTPIPGATTADLKSAFNTNSPSVHLGLTTRKGSSGTLIPTPSEILPRQEIFSTPFAFKAGAVAENGVDSPAIKNQSISLEDLSSAVAAKLTPVGIISPFVGTTPPTGWLLCDGTSVSRTQYPALFTVMGTSHGTGDGSTTFHLPDYRGRFLRGADGPDGSSGDRDPDSGNRIAANVGGNSSGVGSVQNDIFFGHSHLTVSSQNSKPGQDGDLDLPTESIAWYRANGMGGIGHADHGYELGAQTADPDVGKSSFAGGNETRPKNAAVNFIIKY